MSSVKRYWRALGDAPRAAIKKVIRFQIVLFLATTVVFGLLAYSVLHGAGADDPVGALSLVSFTRLLVVVVLGFCIYGLVLVSRAHRAVKSWLFDLEAPGYPTKETWSRQDGLLLGFALLGFTGLPVEIAGLPLLIFLQNWSSLPGTILWIVLGIVLPPIAVRRFIPL